MLARGEFKITYVFNLVLKIECFGVITNENSVCVSLLQRRTFRSVQEDS